MDVGYGVQQLHQSAFEKTYTEIHSYVKIYIFVNVSPNKTFGYLLFCFFRVEHLVMVSGHTRQKKGYFMHTQKQLVCPRGIKG